MEACLLQERHHACELGINGTQLMLQKLTMVDEQNMDPQNLSQLNQLLFNCLIRLVSVMMPVLSYLYAVPITEKNSLSLLPYQYGVFLSNKYFLSQQS
jgi:hypothetical protein